MPLTATITRRRGHRSPSEFSEFVPVVFARPRKLPNITKGVSVRHASIERTATAGPDEELIPARARRFDQPFRTRNRSSYSSHWVVGSRSVGPENRGCIYRYVRSSEEFLES
jgi:hypothetical protein